MRRDPYLDFLRALAIILVLVHHVSQQWPVSMPWLTVYTHYGASGVDLFFVLSGFLIGGIFWREVRENGQVKIWRFWSRRWLRTLPPYLAGLGLAWTAVFTYRNEPFDFGYLFFLQNYYEAIPFFLVSWSLCVEEHFYLFLPLLFMFFLPNGRAGVSGVGLILFIALLFPLLFRLSVVGQVTNEFGYYVTASHLNADGLVLGFGVAYLRYYKEWKISIKVRWYASVVLVSLLILFVTVDFTPSINYVFGRFLLAILFMSLLLLAVESNFSWRLTPQPVVFIALTSYSVYLTHALVIHVVNKFFAHMANQHPWIFFIILMGSIFTVGWIFYRIFELGALKLRENLVPRTDQAGLISQSAAIERV